MINRTVHPVASSFFYCRLFLNYDLSLCYLLFFDLVGLNCCPSSKHTINSELTGTAAD